MKAKWQKSGIEGVWHALADQPGKTLAISKGVHGNEHHGIQVGEDLLSRPIEIAAGRVIMMSGNPEAMEQGVRSIETNQNRCFRELTEEEAAVPPSRWPADLRRAQSLLPVFDVADAMIDLHSYSGDWDPFAIGARRALPAVRKIGAQVFSFDWEITEPGGTDARMAALGKDGICFELGWIDDPDRARGVRLGHEVVQRALSMYGLIPDTFAPLYDDMRLVQALTAVKKENEDQIWHRSFTSFEALQEGEPIVTQGGQTMRANANEVIIFPRSDKDTPMGEELYSVGIEVAA